MTSSPNWREAETPNPSLNIPWTRNRMVAGGHSYRQDTFKRTIPKLQQNLPNDFQRVKRIQEPPAFHNPPVLTKADKFAQAFITRQKLMERVDQYQENLQVLQPGTQPWKIPQKAVKVGEQRSEDAPAIAMNFFTGRTGPADVGRRIPKIVVGESMISPGRQAAAPRLPDPVFITRTTTYHPAQEAEREFLISAPTHSARMLIPTSQARLTTIKIGRSGGVVREVVTPLQAQIRNLGGPSLNDLLSPANAPHPNAPPPYQAMGEELPPAYQFIGTGAHENRRPMLYEPRRVRKVKQAGLAHDRHTSHLPGGTLINAPPQPPPLIRGDLPRVREEQPMIESRARTRARQQRRALILGGPELEDNPRPAKRQRRK
jgi:hypothetical protein